MLRDTSTHCAAISPGDAVGGDGGTFDRGPGLSRVFFDV
jgi:hypothetical protein